MFKFPIKIILLALFSCLICTAYSGTVFAQDEDVKTLGEILNGPQETYGNDGKPLTSAVMANHYYKNCVAQDSLAFNEKELEILCGCTSAKMSEVLTVEEFKRLPIKNGKDARSKMMAFAYAPCIEYIIEDKVTRDCMRSNKLRDIIVGKSLVCGCVNDLFKKYLIADAKNIISRSTLHDPMTLNPLEYYFTGDGYTSQHRGFLESCNFKFRYERDN